MRKETNESLCYSVPDLCGLLGISRPTAYELVHRKGFPVVHIGRKLLVPRAGLEKWLAEQSEGGAA